MLYYRPKNIYRSIYIYRSINLCIDLNGRLYLYIIKPYNSFFVINCHIARQDFILNDQFSGGRNPSKILKYQSIVFYVRCIDVTQTQTESGTEVLQTKAESKYKFGHTELI